MHKEIPQPLPMSPLANGPAKIPAGPIQKKSLKSWNRRELEFESFDKSPILRFSPTAWAKLLFLRDCGDTEVGGLGIASVADLLYVEDVALVRQVSPACLWPFSMKRWPTFSTGRWTPGQVQQFAHLAAYPSRQLLPAQPDRRRDFYEGFWQKPVGSDVYPGPRRRSYARLQFNVGPGGGLTIPVAVDYSRSFAGSNHAAWEKEFLENVFTPPPVVAVEKPLKEVNGPKESCNFLEDGFWPFYQGAEWDDIPEYEEPALWIPNNHRFVRQQELVPSPPCERSMSR